MPSSTREYHIVVLGTGGVGKSCLTSQFVHNVWIESYDPTIEDSYRKQIEVDGRHVILEILDTAGTEQFTAMRELYMKSGKGFVLVFSITSSSSLRELLDLHEQLRSVKNGDPHTPIVLVGNKADLRDCHSVNPDRALTVSQKWGDVPYYETSAKERVNVDEVFVDLCRQIIRKDMVELDRWDDERRRQDVRLGRAGDTLSDRRRRRKKRRRKGESPSGCVIL